MRRSIAVIVVLSLTGLVGAVSARDYVSIVGSSTVYPFATVVAERFGKTSRYKTPKIEATGTGGGMKLFCAGVGVQHPDLVNASRRIKRSEFSLCARNGVHAVIEIKVGYDGIVIANSNRAARFVLTRREIFLALAKQVPDPKGAEKLVANPYTTWKQVNPALPDTRIRVMGPPPTSGTRDVFAELVMEEGCGRFGWIRAMRNSHEQRYKAVCHGMREDGAFVEVGENDNLIVQKLEVDPLAIGVFGFSFLDQNSDKVQGSLVDDVAPEFEAIADGRYPISRPLFVYAKKAHIGRLPGIAEFLAEFTSEKAWGDDGYLIEKGLVPMPREERKKYARDARNQTLLNL